MRQEACELQAVPGAPWRVSALLLLGPWEISLLGGGQVRGNTVSRGSIWDQANQTTATS